MIVRPGYKVRDVNHPKAIYTVTTWEKCAESWTAHHINIDDLSELKLKGVPLVESKDHYFWKEFKMLRQSGKRVTGYQSNETLTTPEPASKATKDWKNPFLHLEPNQNEDGTIGDTGRFL